MAVASSASTPRHFASSSSQKAEPRQANPLYALLGLLVIVASLYVTWAQLEISNAWYKPALHFLGIAPLYQALNVATLGVVFLVLFALVGRLWVADLLLAVVGTALAIGNYYVIVYHNNPVSFLEIKNALTAMNVAGSYTFSITRRVIVVAALLVVQIVLVALVRAAERRSGFKPRFAPRVFVSLLVAGAIVFVGYLSPSPIKPRDTLTGLWTDAYYTYGFPACTVETVDIGLHPVKVPEDYSDEAVTAVQKPAAVAAGQQADIILILNETFSDPSLVCDYTTDVPYLDKTNALTNVIKGHAVIPNVGGSTNGSEYSLLTANNLYGLKPNVTPFNYVNMEGAHSIASVLAGQGYATTAEHPAPSVNYARETSYPGMGFATTHFIDDYENVAYYGERMYATDACTFDNLVRWHDAAVSAGGASCPPQFVYCLTIQNHGEWRSNDASLDLVHATGSFGAHAEEMNEFLSCIKMSDDAFAQLVAHFSASKRPTVVCMVGDHMPSFIQDIADKGRYSAEELDLLMRCTPFVIWANFDIADADLGNVSVNYLAPLVLSVAGAEQSPYFAYQTELMKAYPVLTSYGAYYDAAGQRYTYAADPQQAIADYFNLEYANIAHRGDQSWF